MSVVMPTLSTFGWVQNPLEKLDFALAHFFEADKLQTSIYGSNVSSFQWLLEEAGSNVAQAAVQVRSVLNTYLLRYYEHVSIDVVVMPESSTSPGSRTIMQLSLSVTDGGVEYQTDRLALLNDGKFVSFINANNQDS